VLGQRGGKAGRGDREAHEVGGGEVEVGGGAHGDAVGQHHAGQVALVAAGGAQRKRLVGGAAAELDLEAAAGEHRREADPARPGPDDDRAAQRR